MNMARPGATQTHSQPHHPGLPWVTSSLQFTDPATGEDSLSGGFGTGSNSQGCTRSSRQGQA